jgi:hypothetical protein
MLQKQFLIDTAAPSKGVSYFMIGFAHLTKRDNVEDAASAGSGTLVTIGSLHGVLTPAHVIDALPKQGNVGMILNAEGPAQFRKYTINMDHTEPPVVIKAGQFGPTGPDLAFLRLPDEAVGWLKAKNSFYSLTKRRDAVLGRQEPRTSHTDSICGIIHELTEEVPGEKRTEKRIQFHAIFCGVRPSAVRYLDTHDLLYFQLAVEHEPSFKIPGSFEGASGGGVWRFYVDKAADGQAKVVDSRLIAVPFHQSFTADGKREITCHGSTSIYGTLVDKVTARWPSEANAG